MKRQCIELCVTDICCCAETRYENTTEIRECGSEVRVQPGQEAEGRDQGWST